MGKERVEAEQVLAESAPAAVRLKPLQPIQRIGLWLAGFVGTTILVVIVFVLIDYVRSAPPALEIPPVASQESIKLQLENHKASQELVIDRTTKIFDLIVVKALLPVFTAILGYIFGTRTMAKDETA